LQRIAGALDSVEVVARPGRHHKSRACAALTAQRSGCCGSGVQPDAGTHVRRRSSGPSWLRLGFRLVGRRQQLAFYRNVCRRMRRLTESQLEMADVTRREERSG